MLAIFSVPMNIIILKMIPINDNINDGNLQHEIFEQNIGKAVIYCQIYLSSILCVPKLLIITKNTDINVGNISCNSISQEAVFSW